MARNSAPSFDTSSRRGAGGAVGVNSGAGGAVGLAKTVGPAESVVYALRYKLLAVYIAK